MDYAKLVAVYEDLEQTASRLKKVELIADFLKTTDAHLLPAVTLLVQGRLFPSYDEKEIGIANLLMIRIIASATGFSQETVMKKFKKHGDFGLVAEDLIAHKKQKTLFTKKLSVEKVLENLRKLAFVEGKGSQDRKFRLVSELIGSAGANEAKYVVRTTLSTLRIGVAEGVIRDAIAKAFFADVVWGEARIKEIIKHAEKQHILIEHAALEKIGKKKDITEKDIHRFKTKNKVVAKTGKEIEKTALWKGDAAPDTIILLDEKLGNTLKSTVIKCVEWAWFLRSDYGEIAHIARTKGLNGLKKVTVEPGKPYHVLLSEKAPSLQDALDSYERPAIEVKYDGARVAIHKKGSQVWIFTRRLENVTAQFPDIAAYAKQAVQTTECIIEGEALAVDPRTKRPLPFQSLSQRIQRKYDVEKTMKEIPVQVNLFDIIYLNGHALFDKSLTERRKKLESIIHPIRGTFQLAEQLITKDLTKAQVFYEHALKNNQEGVMVKNLDAAYQPGRRVGFWLKVKPVMENLDLALIGAVWGTGKRTGWLGSFLLGCRDPKSGEFLECGMLGTGIKEKKTNPSDITFKDLSNMLKPLIIKERENKVTITPKIIIEVAYEEIQKSPNYESGYALRFPRFMRLRTADKSLQDVDTVERIAELYALQKGKGSAKKQ